MDVPCRFFEIDDLAYPKAISNILQEYSLIFRTRCVVVAFILLPSRERTLKQYSVWKKRMMASDAVCVMVG